MDGLVQLGRSRRSDLSPHETFGHSFLQEILSSGAELRSAHRTELESLAAENDPELFWEDLHRLANRIQSDGHPQSSLQIYRLIRDRATDPGIRDKASSALDALEGQGKFGQRFEYHFTRFREDAFAPSSIVPMMLGTGVFQLTKGLALARMASAANPAWWMRGPVARALAGSLGFGLEVPAFALSGRAMRAFAREATVQPDLTHELASAAITLGALKASGLASRSLLKGSSLRNSVAVQWGGSQAAMFLALLSAHRLEESLGLREKREGATTVLDTLAGMVSLGFGASLGGKLLGPGYARWMGDIERRSSEGLGNFAGLRLPAKPAFAGGPEPLNLLSEKYSDSKPERKYSDWSSVDSLSGRLEGKSQIGVHAFLETIDMTMAFAEAARWPSADFGDWVRSAKLWDLKSYQGMNLPVYVRPLMPRLFEPLLEKIRNEHYFKDEAAWRELSDELLLYSYACSIGEKNLRGGTDSNTSINEFHQRLAYQRALARLLQSEGRVSVEKSEWEQWLERYPPENPKSYRKLVTKTGPFDPFAPVSKEIIPEFYRDQPWHWLRRRGLTINFMRELNERRKEYLQGKGSLETLQALMAEQLPIRLKALNLRRSILTPRDLMGWVDKAEKRPVIWNPFNLENRESLVIHPHHGEGTVGARHGDQWTVHFPDALPVKLLRHTIVEAQDRERYREVLDKRVLKYGNMAYIYSLLTIRHHLAGKEWAEIQSGLEESGDVRKVTTLSQSIQLLRAMDKIKPASIQALDRTLHDIADRTGIDPITFSLTLMVGETPHELIFDGARQVRNKTKIARNFTPELVRETLRARPWMRQWGALGRSYPPNVRTIGHYYPQYYPQQNRPHDLTELYFAFRNGDPEAFAVTAELFAEPVRAWMSEGEREKSAVIVPMIGQAPLQELAKEMGYPVVFPWAPRPQDYGKGVEGQRAAVKMRMVQRALRLDSEKIEEIRGRPVLVLDDNTTDFVTWMAARKLLLDAGASEAGLVILTQTQRNPRELSWSLR